MGRWLFLGLALLLSGCSMFRATSQRELLLTVDDRGYAPNLLQVEAGESVLLTLDNIGAVEHHFAIQKISIVTRGRGMNNMPGMDMSGMSEDMSNLESMPQLHLVAAAGERNTLEFTPTQAGQYEFKCVVPGHSEVGSLFVRG